METLAADLVYVRTDSALSFRLETVGNPGVLELEGPHTYQVGFMIVPLDLLLCGSPQTHEDAPCVFR